jgi:hypothetical protein
LSEEVEVIGGQEGKKAYKKKAERKKERKIETNSGFFPIESQIYIYLNSLAHLVILKTNK